MNKLVIRDAALEDAGKYTAIIGDEQVAAQLTVEDFLELLKPLKDQTVTEKDTIKLSVEVSDKVLPGTWLKDGKPIEAAENIKMESLNGKFELTITNCQLEDAGCYSFVMNELKTDCKVTVNGKLLF